MKPFLHGKKTLPITTLRPPSGLATALAMSCGNGHPNTMTPSNNSGASVEVVKEGDKVIRLIVTCTCGERVEIECLYPAGS
jgi:hypothetical protein